MKRAEQNCGNCDAFLVDAQRPAKGNDAQQGFCRAGPPSVIQTMVKVGSVINSNGQQMAPALQGVQPPQSANGWCRQWKENAGD